MASIEIFLLQSPKIIHDSSPCRLPYQKAEALLYYLAIEKRATREQAASLLWDQCDEAAARKNLRHAIFTVKKALGEECILPYGRQELILNPDISITLDYDQLIQEECTDVYHGEFLTSFYIKGAPAFEEWMLAKRHYALHTYLKLIYRQLSLLPDSDVEESERLFRLYMEEDPLDENIYRLMMERYRACGLYYKGLKLYDRMVHLFEKELSASPGKELQKLHHRMLDALNAERPVLQEAVEELPGREKELLFLSDAFQRFMGGESTSILLSGIDGSGKTYLAEYFTRNLSNSSFLILQASCLETEKDVLLKPVSTMILQLQPLLERYHLKVDPSHLEAASRLFPLTGSIDTWAYSLLFKLFYSIGEQIPLVLSFDNLQYMDSASLDFISMLIRGRNPNILFFGTVLPFCSNMNKILKPLCEENLLSHLEISPPASVESGTAVKAMKADYFCQLSGPAESLSHTGTSVLELLSACQSKASFGLFEDLLRENPLNILDTLEQLKNLGIIEERFEQQSPYFVFCNNSTRKMIYERMSPSRRCYYHRILAEHLKHMEALGASDYECLIYHYCRAGSQAMELKCRILALEEYMIKNYELYPMQYAPHRENNGAIPSFTGYCNILEDRLLSLPENEASSIPFSRLYALLLRTKAQYCIARGEYKEGLACQKKALLINSQTDRDPLMRIRCLRLVNFYRLNIWSTKDLDHSLSECLTLGKEGGFEEDYAIDCRLYGLFKTMEGNYAAGLRYLKRALRIFSKYPLKSRIYTLNIAGCYNYMGEAYRKQQQFARAVRFYQKAVQTCEAAHACGNAVFYSNLGRAYLAMGRKEESADAFYLSNRLFNDSAALIGRSITKGYVSILEAEKGNFSASRELIAEAGESARLLNSPQSLGLLALACSELTHRWPDEFSSILKQAPDEYRREAAALLKNIPGAYETGEL